MQILYINKKIYINIYINISIKKKEIRIDQQLTFLKKKTCYVSMSVKSRQFKFGQ